MEVKDYRPDEIEPKWQAKWEEAKIFSPDLDRAKKPFYNLMMFPYPSAEGLHVGNMYAFTGADIYGRFTRMQGYEVFEPIGLDGFGIHSENYAIKLGEHPAKLAKRTQQNFYRQLRATGNAYDWQRTLETYDPSYYKWTQWLFVQMFKHGLAFRAKSPVNWCPSDKTVLADEQVIAGKCERCGSQVQIRHLEQWFFKITDYAQRLLSGLEKIDWSKKVKIAQRNWIGRSEGAQIEFKIQNSKFKIPVFTTRPDTLFGSTFLVLSPDSPWVEKITTSKYKKVVEKYIKEREKTGVFTGSYAINPVTREKIPIWVADYVVGGYGAGAIMGVPAHDERDFEFAKRHHLPIKQVIVPQRKNYELPFTDYGILASSGEFTGLRSEKAIPKIAKWLEEKNLGRASVQYHLRDWLISRQRYWGPPIPMIYCEHCAKEGKDWFTREGRVLPLASPTAIPPGSNTGAPSVGLPGSRHPSWNVAGLYPVPEKDLPVELPYIKNYQPKGTGESPLAQDKKWMRVKCPGCGREARRETDVSDTFLDSSWYFLRYLATEFDEAPLPPAARSRRWLPVQMYIGGAEHAVLHLMYVRFMTMALKDFGYLPFAEPFPRFYAHGLLIAEGAKMSKSRGNIVIPDEYIKKFGADTLRCYLMFLGPFDQGGDFRDTGIEGMHRFIKRVWDLITNWGDVVLVEASDTQDVLRFQHLTVRKVTQDLANLRYNTALSHLMEFVNLLREKTKGFTPRVHPEGEIKRAGGGIRCAEWDEAIRTLVLLLAPFAPHMTEELWQRFAGHRQPTTDHWSVHFQPWPKYREELLSEERITIPIQVNGKLRGTIELAPGEAKDRKRVEARAKEVESIARHLKDKKVQKVIFIPQKLINFVTA